MLDLVDSVSCCYCVLILRLGRMMYRSSFSLI